MKNGEKTAPVWFVDPSSPDPQVIMKAAKILKKGQCVIFPTETVYGIGVNANNAEGIKKVFQIKNRPLNKPLSYHFSSLEDFFIFAGEGLDESTVFWFKKWMPNPVTLIYHDHLRKKNIGVRIPDHPVAKALIAETGIPVLAPSANFSGDPPPVEASQINPDLLGKVDLVLDSGKTGHQQESTVIDLSHGLPVVVRKGAFSI